MEALTLVPKGVVLAQKELESVQKEFVLAQKEWESDQKEFVLAQKEPAPSPQPSHSGPAQNESPHKEQFQTYSPF